MEEGNGDRVSDLINLEVEFPAAKGEKRLGSRGQAARARSGRPHGRAFRGRRRRAGAGPGRDRRVLRGHGIEVVAETHAAREALRVVTMDGCGLVVLGAPADSHPPTRPAVCRAPPSARDRRPRAARARPPGRLSRRARCAGSSCAAPRVEELGAAIEAAGKGVPYVAPALLGALAGAIRPALERGESDAARRASGRCSCCWPRAGRTGRSRPRWPSRWRQ